MARIGGKLIYTIPKWRLAVGKVIIWPVAWAYAFGIMSDAQLERIIDCLARFVCGDILRNSRVDWE